RPLAAIATSIDGDVLIADASQSDLRGTVYAPDGSVLFARRPVAQGGVVRKAEVARGGTVVALQTASGWSITSLASGRTLDLTPGGVAAVDATIAPDGRTVAAATVYGVVFASLPGLAPESLIALPAQGVAWFSQPLFRHLRTAPVRSIGGTASPTA